MPSPSASRNRSLYPSDEPDAAPGFGHVAVQLFPDAAVDVHVVRPPVGAEPQHVGIFSVSAQEALLLADGAHSTLQAGTAVGGQLALTGRAPP